MSKKGSRKTAFIFPGKQCGEIPVDESSIRTEKEVNSGGGKVFINSNPMTVKLHLFNQVILIFTLVNFIGKFRRTCKENEAKRFGGEDYR